MLFRVFPPLPALALLLCAAVPAATGPSATVNVQILAVNDFHGHLLPPAGSSGRVGSTDAGGIEYLAAHINRLRELNPHTVVVSAGDLIGASPLLSALFHDEPTIEAFNQIGLDFNAVGNHEFDEGVNELIRMQEGGCHVADGCQDGDGYAGARFRFLAANVRWKKNGQPIFPAYQIRSFNGVQLAFIGMTLEGTPRVVMPSGVAELDFLDEAETVNALIPELRKQGIETIVVLLHEGGQQAPANPAINGCSGISGPIVDIVERLDDAVDVVVTGHTHQYYNCILGHKLVTSAFSFGRLVTKIDMTIDRHTGEVSTLSADNRIVTRDVPKDGALTALIDKYNAIAAPLASRVKGAITGDITHTQNAAGESALGDVIADSQLAATQAPESGGAVVAFMHPGGIRTDLVYASGPAGEGDGNVTYGEIFAIQPFGNNLVTLTLTGAEIDAVLEQQFAGCGGQTEDRILQVSKGFTYAWSRSAPSCGKVDPASIKINAVTVDPSAAYRVTVNSFLADGGDNFSVFTQGTGRLVGDEDTGAFENYLAKFSPLAPGPQNRITANR
jgi:5'-nucleotidase